MNECRSLTLELNALLELNKIKIEKEEEDLTPAVAAEETSIQYGVLAIGLAGKRCLVLKNLLQKKVKINWRLEGESVGDRFFMTNEGERFSQKHDFSF